jgi:hypothetical protein
MHEFTVYTRALEVNNIVGVYTFKKTHCTTTFHIYSDPSARLFKRGGGAVLNVRVKVGLQLQ